MVEICCCGIHAAMCEQGESYNHYVTNVIAEQPLTRINFNYFQKGPILLQLTIYSFECVLPISIYTNPNYDEVYSKCFNFQI